MFWKEPCIQQHFADFLISIIAAALPDVIHITPFENPLYHKAGLLVEINELIFYIPEDAVIEMRGFLHYLQINNYEKPWTYPKIQKLSIPKCNN
jgi:hypothetical protein